METLETRTIAKVSARLVPFLIVCYFVAYLDRVNVSFAALTMNKDLGLSASAFGFGAGIFFIAYFVFEVPSNLFLERVGARKWIARIMFTWGVCSGAMAFIGGGTSFYVVRALLGIAEALLVPMVAFLFQATLFSRPLLLAGLLAGGTIGFSAVGTLFAAMLVRARSRDVLLPILLYPITIPVIIAGVRGTAALLESPPDEPIARSWFAPLSQLLKSPTTLT